MIKTSTIASAATRVLVHAVCGLVTEHRGRGDSEISLRCKPQTAVCGLVTEEARRKTLIKDFHDALSYRHRWKALKTLLKDFSLKDHNSWKYVWTARAAHEKIELRMQTVVSGLVGTSSLRRAGNLATFQTTKPWRDQGFFCRSGKAQNMQTADYLRRPL